MRIDVRCRLKAVLCLLVMLSGVALSGCAAYQLRGTVIEGKQSRIVVVKAGDPRLGQRGLGNVAITVTQEPQSLGRKQVGEGVTDGEGHFTIPISTFGAGFLEYQMGIVARRQGRAPAIKDMQLPGADWRLLIELAPGKDELPGGGDDFLKNTLKESQPYLNGD